MSPHNISLWSFTIKYKYNTWFFNKPIAYDKKMKLDNNITKSP